MGVLQHDGPMDEGLADHGMDIVYRLYGQLMHQFQLLEMNLWAIKALRFKDGVQMHQGIVKLESWDAHGLFGQLVNDLAPLPTWPAEMVGRLREAASIRNYLAHRFLREFFVAKDSEEKFDRGITQLVTWIQSMNELDADLESHVSSLPGGEVDPELAALLEEQRPDSWPIGAQ